jgi:hypothetical protein
MTLHETLLHRKLDHYCVSDSRYATLFSAVDLLQTLLNSSVVRNSCSLALPLQLHCCYCKTMVAVALPHTHSTAATITTIMTITIVIQQGAVWSAGEMSPTVNSSTFTNNSCTVTAAGDTSYGGAVAVGVNSSITIAGAVTHRCLVLLLLSITLFVYPIMRSNNFPTKSTVS